MQMKVRCIWKRLCRPECRMSIRILNMNQARFRNNPIGEMRTAGAFIRLPPAPDTDTFRAERQSALHGRPIMRTFFTALMMGLLICVSHSRAEDIVLGHFGSLT